MADLASERHDFLIKMLEHFVLGVLAQRGHENLAHFIKHLIGDAEVLVHLSHGPTDVESRAIEFVFEEGAEFLLQDLHLLLILKLPVVPCKLLICHHVFHERIDKHGHFFVASKLFENRFFLGDALL